MKKPEFLLLLGLVNLFGLVCIAWSFHRMWWRWFDWYGEEKGRMMHWRGMMRGRDEWYERQQYQNYGQEGRGMSNQRYYAPEEQATDNQWGTPPPAQTNAPTPDAMPSQPATSGAKQ